MFRRVVRGDRAGGCVLEVVMMMGLEDVILEPYIVIGSCSSCEVPVDGPLRTMVRAR